MKITTFFTVLALTSNIFLLQADNAIPLSVSKTFEIPLESNKTTGYSWKGSCCPAGIVEISQSVYKTEENTTKVGSGGTEVFTVTAKKPGTATCTFNYAKSWQKDVAPAKTQTFTFTITPKKSCCQ